MTVTKTRDNWYPLDIQFTELYVGSEIGRRILPKKKYTAKLRGAVLEGRPVAIPAGQNNAIDWARIQEEFIAPPPRVRQRGEPLRAGVGVIQGEGNVFINGDNGEPF